MKGQTSNYTHVKPIQDNETQCMMGTGVFTTTFLTQGSDRIIQYTENLKKRNLVKRFLFLLVRYTEVFTEEGF